MLRKDFFEKHPLYQEQDIFYSGNWQISRNENENHLNGVLYIPLRHFIGSGGYNEYIRTYGWGDSDLYERLERTLEKKNINGDYIFHLPHGDSIRSGNKDVKIEIIKNMHLAKKRPWNKSNEKVEYVKVDDSKEIYQPVNLDLYQTPYQLVQKCTKFAFRCVLNDAGFTWNMTKNKNFPALAHMAYNRNRPKLIIEPKNGLGNRLRALASAAVVAQASKRNLVVIWTCDNHCEAKFSDLFRSEDLFFTDNRNEVDYCFKEVSESTHSFADYYDTSDKPVYSLNCSTNKNIYIVSACVLKSSLTDWTKESNWIRNNLHPIDHLEDEINYYSEMININSAIGLHIRMGQPAAKYSYEDSKGWDERQKNALEKFRKDSNYVHFMIEMEKIWRHNPDQVFFLCADNQEIYDAFHERYPDRIHNTIKYVPKAVYNRSVKQLQSALLDSYLLSKCSYVFGSPWSSFTELVSRLGRVKLLIAGKDFGITKYGLLFYPGSYNIGDDIQSLAASRFLPLVDYYIDRDNQQDFIYDEFGEPKGSFDSVLEENKKIKLIANGWYDGRLTKFPPNSKISPLFVSFHLNEGKDLFSEHNYQVIKELAKMDESMLDNEEKINYLKRNSPIGTRDIHTKDILAEKGILAYHTGCLTLTLKPIAPEAKTDNIYVVDANILEPKLFSELVPVHIAKKATYISHGLEKLLPLQEKQELARELLSKYQNAKLVITSRIHCALPCLALGTPFIFLYSKMDTDPRFDDTFRGLLGNGTSLPKNWDWENPKIKRSQTELARSIASKLEKTVSEFIKQ